MNDIFRDVDEALKQEKLEAFWKENGNYIITLILFLIIGTGLWSGYQYWQKTEAEKHTTALMDIAEQENPGVSAETLKNLGDSQKAVALMLLAQKNLDGDKPQAALQNYIDILSTVGASDEIKGLAAYYARNVALTYETDTAFEEIHVPENSIWQSYYDLQDAIYLVEQKQDYDQALLKLDAILIEGSPTPRGVQEIAKELRHVYLQDRPALTTDNESEEPQQKG